MHGACFAYPVSNCVPAALWPRLICGGDKTTSPEHITSAYRCCARHSRLFNLQAALQILLCGAARVRAQQSALSGRVAAQAAGPGEHAVGPAAPGAGRAAAGPAARGRARAAPGAPGTFGLSQSPEPSLLCVGFASQALMSEHVCLVVSCQITLAVHSELPCWVYAAVQVYVYWVIFCRAYL